MDSTKNEKPRALVSAEEESRIERQVMVWLRAYPELPEAKIGFQDLAPGAPGIAVFADEGAYVEKQYICGGHQGAYPFSVVRRILPGDSPDLRLQAVELLNKLGGWMAKNPPELGDGIRDVKVTPTTRGRFAGVGEDGDEDYEIQIRIIYEVI